MKTTHKSFWLPTRPYGIIDAINRRSAATGSCRRADLATHADYNGHRVTVCFNDYRRYWVAEYTWMGRQVIGRGNLIDCLRAAKAEYDRGALGAEVVVTVDYCGKETFADMDVAIILASGFQPCDEEVRKAHLATWQDARFERLNEAFMYEQHGLAPTVGFLANSKTVEEYDAKREAHFAEQVARRAALRARAASGVATS